MCLRAVLNVRLIDFIRPVLCSLFGLPVFLFIGLQLKQSHPLMPNINTGPLVRSPQTSRSRWYELHRFSFITERVCYCLLKFLSFELNDRISRLDQSSLSTCARGAPCFPGSLLSRFSVWFSGLSGRFGLTSVDPLFSILASQESFGAQFTRGAEN